MPTIHLKATTTATPEQFVAVLSDFGPGRQKVFENSTDENLKVHDKGPDHADVTEGSGGIWERLHYDWSDPNRVVIKTTDSNTWGGASSFTYTRDGPTGRPRWTKSWCARARTSRAGRPGSCSNLREARPRKGAGEHDQGHRSPNHRGASGGSGQRVAQRRHDGGAKRTKLGVGALRPASRPRHRRLRLCVGIGCAGCCRRGRETRPRGGLRWSRCCPRS
jgi:hypothetical protein